MVAISVNGLRSTKELQVSNGQCLIGGVRSGSLSLAGNSK